MLTVEQKNIRLELNQRIREGETIQIAVWFTSAVKMGTLKALSVLSDEYKVVIGNDEFKLFESVNRFELYNATKTKNNDKKGSVVKMENIKNVLVNGVKVYSLEVENDTEQAQELLNLGTVTSKIDAWCAYEERVDNDFIGSYVVNVQRVDDYRRFVTMLENVKCSNKHEEIRARWHRDEINYDEYCKEVDMINNCKCNVCELRTPTFEEWKDGMYRENVWNDYTNSYRVKESKLGKYLLKQGIEQSIVDFYSAQIKTEKMQVLTVSSHAQHIAGMSTYAKRKSWNGYAGTSCQDTRLNTSMALHLAGSLNDDKLFVAMLHDSLEDLDNMQDKLKARVLMRLVTIEGVQHLIPTKYYGNNETIDLLDNALKQLDEVRIHDMSVRNFVIDGDNVQFHNEDANGFYTMHVMDEIEIYEHVRREVEVECPLCDGEEEITRYNDDDIEVTVTCPMCHGSGEYTVYIEEEIDTYAEVEVEKEISPYFNNETWEHECDYIEITINYSEIERREVKNGHALL